MYNPSETIVITHNGHTTLATYIKDNKIVTKKAMCHPDDKFDFGVSSLLTVERLFPESKIVVDSLNDIKEKAKKPKNHLIKDNEFICELGIKADFKDVFNQDLYTGDIVECRDDWTDKITTYPIVFYNGRAVLANHRFVTFIDGKANSRFYIRKIKSYEAVPYGSIYNGYLYINKN